MVEDIHVESEHAVRNPVVPDELPYVFLRVQFRASGWQREDVDVRRDDESRRPVPASVIDQKGHMGAGHYLCHDAGEMQVHCFHVASGQSEPGSLALFWADRAKNLRRSSPLILGRDRTRPSLGRSPRDLVFLADARLVGEP
jgi:hypothetical protein